MREARQEADEARLQARLCAAPAAYPPSASELRESSREMVDGERPRVSAM